MAAIPVQDKPLEYDYHYNVDQQVSVNAFMEVNIDGEAVRFQVTSRYGSTPEKIARTVHATIDAYRLLRQEYPRQLIQPPPAEPQDTEPKYTPVDDTGSELPPINRFIVERLSVKLEDGKFFYKVMGGNFTQYGISVWPEVLQAAKLPTGTVEMPSINGWTAEYAEQQKDGHTRRKVTRLLPPK